MKPFIVGVTGGSGSGKTTFVKRIKKTFTKKEVCFISQDDYYRPRNEQEMDALGVKNFDLPNSIDEKAFIEDVKLLMEGQVLNRKEYTFNNEKKDPKLLTFTPAPIILVEGIFVMHFKKMRDLLDLKIFLHAKENLKVIRRIKRDQIERNYPIDDVLYRYEHHVLPTFEKYIKPYMDEADIIINNNKHFDRGLNVITGFFKEHLRQHLNDYYQ